MRRRSGTSIASMTPEALLVADLDEAVATDGPRDGREHRLDLRLLGGRLEHPRPLRLPETPKVLAVGFLDHGRPPLDGDLDPNPDLGQVGEELPPLVMSPQADELGPVGGPVQRPT